MRNSLTSKNESGKDKGLPVHGSSHGDFKNFMTHLWHMIDFPWSNEEEAQPKIAVSENKADVVVSAEMPGVDANNIDLQISSDGYLTISAEKKDENSSHDKNHYFSEISYGMVRRTVPLPWDLDYNKANAEYNDGILKVTFPKTNIEQQKLKKIGVKGKKTASASSADKSSETPADNASGNKMPKTRRSRKQAAN